MHPASTATVAASAASTNTGGGAGTYSMDGPTLHHSHRTSIGHHHHLNIVSGGGFADIQVGVSKLPPHLHIHSHQSQHQHHVSPPTSPSTARRTRPPAPGRTSRRRATVGPAQLPSPSSETVSRRYPSNENLAARDRHALPAAGYAISSTTMDKLQHTLTYQDSSQDSASASCRPETCVYYQQLLLSAEIGQELLHKYTSACTDLDSLKTSSSVLDAELATLRSTNDQLTQRNALLTSDLDAAKSQVATLESALIDSQSAHALAMSAMQVHQSKMDASERECGRQVKAAEHEVAEVRAKLDRADARGREWKDGYTQACEDRDSALARAADAESTIARLESELGALRASVDEAAVVDSPTSPNLSKNDVALLLSTLADLQAAHDQLQSEHTDLLSQFRQVQDDLASARDEHTASSAQPAHDETFDSDVSAWLLQVDPPASSARRVERTASVSLGDEMAAAAVQGPATDQSMSFALAVGGSTMSQRMVVDAWTQCDKPTPESTEPDAGGISSDTIQDWVSHMHHLVDSAHALRARIHAADPASMRRSRSATPVFGVSASAAAAANWSWDDLCCMGHEVLDAIEGELAKLVSVSEEAKPMSSHADRNGGGDDADEALAFSASNKHPPTGQLIDTHDNVSPAIHTPPAILAETKSTIQSLLHTILADAIAQQRSVIDASRAYVAIVDAKAAEFSRQVQLEHNASPQSAVARSRAGTSDSRMSTRQRVRTSDSQPAATVRARSPLASPARAPAGSQSAGASPARGVGEVMGRHEQATPVKKARARLFGVF